MGSYIVIFVEEHTDKGWDCLDVIEPYKWSNDYTFLSGFYNQDDINPLAPARGMPKDASKSVKSDTSRRDDFWETHYGEYSGYGMWSYLTYEDFKDVDLDSLPPEFPVGVSIRDYISYSLAELITAFQTNPDYQTRRIIFGYD